MRGEGLSARSRVQRGEKRKKEKEKRKGEKESDTVSAQAAEHSLRTGSGTHAGAVARLLLLRHRYTVMEMCAQRKREEGARGDGRSTRAHVAQHKRQREGFCSLMAKSSGRQAPCAGDRARHPGAKRRPATDDGEQASKQASGERVNTEKWRRAAPCRRRHPCPPPTALSCPQPGSKLAAAVVFTVACSRGAAWLPQRPKRWSPVRTAGPRVTEAKTVQRLICGHVEM